MLNFSVRSKIFLQTTVHIDENKALSGAGAISVNKYKHVEMNISGTTNSTVQSSLAGGTSSSTTVVHDQMDQKTWEGLRERCHQQIE